METFLRLLIVVGLAVGIYWAMWDHSRSHPVREKVESAIHEAKKAVSEIDETLDVGSIVSELKQTGKVVRRKTVQTVRKVAKATEDARTSAAIMAELAFDPELRSFAITVNTTNGRVTLAGLVDSPADIAQAMRIALRHDNVREVVSTLQVRSSPEELWRVKRASVG